MKFLYIFRNESFFVIIVEIVLCDTNNFIIDFSIQIQTTLSILIDSKDYNPCVFIAPEIINVISCGS